MSLKLTLSGRASGILFMALFGAAWAGQAGSKLPMPYTAIIYVIAAIVAALLVWVSFRFRQLAPSQPPSSAEEVAAAQRAGRWFYWILGVEGVALFVTGNVLLNLHLILYIWPAMALIVGLHFFPLRYTFRLPVYAVTGALMTVVALVALAALATGHGLGILYGWDVVTGICCALVLWGTCGYVWLKVRAALAEATP